MPPPTLAPARSDLATMLAAATRRAGPALAARPCRRLAAPIGRRAMSVSASAAVAHEPAIKLGGKLPMDKV